MATDGTPEAAAKRCGEAIAQLRTLRRWSRAHLVIRLFDELLPDDPNYDSISETWLARLENGRMVKVPRQTIEALCRALRCNPRERAHVLLHADRCALTDAECRPTPPAEVLAFVMDRLYTEAFEAINGMLRERGAAELDELDDVELFEMAASALDTLITRRERQQSQAGAGAASQTARPAQHQPSSGRDGRIALIPRLAASAGRR